MVSKEKFRVFLEKLQSYFVSDNSEEWVDIEFIDSRRLDIRIVSDMAEDMNETEGIIGEALIKLNENVDEENKIIIAYKNYHTLDEAEFLNIKKPIRRDVDLSSFTKIIKNRYEEIHEERVNKSKVISFYSYKGGVGRTVALIQTAYLLAKSGKKVLLMDLDIEAPSFLNIFSEEIHKEKGLVDYLYSKLYSTNREVYLSDVLSILNEDISGEIYLIPAGKLGMDYVEKLEQLKEKRIYENKYIQKLIREVENEYEIDYTLIDSRTGINNWGALSLIDISDEVFLFAYPNKENIEGIKLIREIIKERRESTVVLSRVHSSNEANQISCEYFEELELEQKLISILYDPGIAVAKKFPAKDLTKAYEKIYSIIIEREWNGELSSVLKLEQKSVENILEKLNEKIKSYFNGKEPNIYLNNELKIADNSKVILILNDEYMKKLWNSTKDSMYIIQDDEKAVVVPSVDNSMISIENINNYDNVKSLIYAYLMKIINEDKYNNSFKNNIDKLKGEDIKKYIQFVEESQDFIFDLGELVKVKGSPQLRGINICLFFNKLKNDFGKIEDLEGIIEALMRIRRVLDIGIKIQFDDKNYQKYRTIIDRYDTNLLKLSWNIRSEENTKIVCGEIKEVIQRQIEYFILESMETLIDRVEKSKANKFNIEDATEKRRHMREGIILGKRVNPKLYSEEMVEWIYYELKKHNLLSKDDLMRVIKLAAEIEIENFENKKEFDRIISKSSLSKAVEKLSN